MYLEEIKELDLELTSYCNIQCPMCPRFDQDTYPNLDSNIQLKHIGYELIISIIDQCPTLEKVILCGNFGDPLMHPNIKEIFELLYSRGISIYVSTNGSMRSSKFWAEIAKFFPNNGKSLMNFAVDGLSDTNKLYRVGSDWSTIERNMKSFIENGGRAGWRFVVFEHNEHQIEEARKLAMEMGFIQFTEIISCRFGNFKDIHNVKPPETKKYQAKKSDELVCKRQIKNSIFVSYEGLLFPCCWTASTFYKKIVGFKDWSNERRKEVTNEINLNNHKLFDILKTSKFFNIDIIGSWKTCSPFKTCEKRCKNNIVNTKTKTNL